MNNDKASNIFLSIIISTFNRADILNETLEYFSHINLKNLDYELLIIDNNSSDNTKNIIDRFRNIINVIYYVEKKQGKNFALNTGLQRAKGDIIIFSDDDITPHPQWLTEIINICNRWPEINIFGGRVVPVFPPGSNPKITNSYFSDFMFTKHDPMPHEGIYRDTYPVGPNCWIRRKLIESGEKFNVEMGPIGKGRISGGEIEFFHRMSNKGEKIVYAPSVIVEHRVRNSQFEIKYLIKRSFAGGRGWVRIRDPFNGSIFLFGAPRFLYRLAVEALLSIPIYVATGRNYLEPFLKFFEYAGCIYEYRCMNKRNFIK
ncbi:MAG: glycosyltransferase family 2 protein [Desulfobulbus sp.]